MEVVVLSEITDKSRSPIAECGSSIYILFFHLSMKENQRGVGLLPLKHQTRSVRPVRLIRSQVQRF